MTLADRLRTEFSREGLANDADLAYWGYTVNGELRTTILDHEVALVERVIARAQEIAGEDERRVALAFDLLGGMWSWSEANGYFATGNSWSLHAPSSPIPPSSNSGRRAVAEPWWWTADTEDDDNWLSEFGGEDIRALVRERNALRASLDPDNAEAVEAWAAALYRVFGGTPDNPYREIDATALLRARAEVERPYVCPLCNHVGEPKDHAQHPEPPR